MADEQIESNATEPGATEPGAVDSTHPDGVATVVETVSDAPPSETDQSNEPKGDETSQEVTLDPELVARARVFNMTEEDLRAVPAPIVQRMLAGADRAMLNAFREESRSANAQADRRQPAGNADPAPADSGGFTYEPLELKFGEDDDVAEPIVNTFKAMQEHHAKQIERLNQHYARQFESVRDFASNVERRHDYAILDRFVDKLGPDWSDVFGQGSRLDLDPRSQEFLKSEELRTAAIEHMQIHSRMTGQTLSAPKALSRALDSMFFDKRAAIERGKADAERKKLKESSVVRPKTSGAVQSNGGIRSRASQMVESMRP